jgi:general secretion pathway protein A
VYRSFFGLRDRPFDLTPDPAYLLLTSGHREALAMLQYGIDARKGLIVLTGEAGTGKTTLLRTTQLDARDTTTFVTVTNPRLERDEFIETVVRGFCLEPEAAASKPRMLRALQDVLLRHLDEQRRCALIVDEAHSLSDELLEEVRLLANLETDSTKLLSIVLAGQPELAQRLNENTQWHLKQRVALRCELRRLTIEETCSFVAWRIRQAGGHPSAIFTLEAVKACHTHGCGIPRLISVISDNALIAAYAAGEKPVTAARVLDACRDLDLLESVSEPAPARAAVPDAPAPAPVPIRPHAAQHAAAAPADDESPSLFRLHTQPRRAWFFR